MCPGMNTAAEPSPPPLFSPPVEGPLLVNERCAIYEQGFMRVVYVDGQPVFRYDVNDANGPALFMAQAQVTGLAGPGELAAALDVSLSTVHRARRKLEEHGVEGVMRKKRGPKSARVGKEREGAIARWYTEGLSVSEMARRVGLARATVRNALSRLGLVERAEGVPPALPFPTEPSAESESVALPEALQEADEAPVEEPVVVQAEEAPPAAVVVHDRQGRPIGSLDNDPLDRSMDRLLAQQGKLHDASPWFVAASDVPMAGVLLALPLLVLSGVFDVAHRVYGSMGSAFYGPRTTILASLLFALLRIKRAENLKEYSPSILGRILGLDRAPEVKTVRRKLAGFVEDNRSEDFIQALFAHRTQQHEQALGFLYVDGHVRVYHGQADIPKTHAARIRMAVPATQDTWVHDSNGDPLFVVTEQAHPQLVSALPAVLQRIRATIGHDRRITVIFDRGGWSPKLFKELVDSGVDIVTYRKGASEDIPVECFQVFQAPTDRGTETYELNDMCISLLNGKLHMRQITRRKGDHQTQIVTTRQDLDAVEVAQRMFARWRQENFFKYMRAEYALDALVEHGTEPDPLDREVPNPDYKALTTEVNAARKEVAELEARYGAAALDNPETKRRTMRGFKIAHGTEIGIPLRDARARLAALRAKRRATPARVQLSAVRSEAIRLRPQRKRFTDAIKMVAYQAETDLVRCVAPSYKRSLDEGRRLMAAAFQSAADIEPTSTELRVTLAPLSSPHRSEAIAKLCTILNDTQTVFPGTRLRLKFAVRGFECVS